MQGGGGGYMSGFGAVIISIVVPLTPLRISVGLSFGIPFG